MALGLCAVSPTTLSTGRGEKKAITAKVPLQSAVTCLIWPHTQPSFVFGQADGKVSDQRGPAPQGTQGGSVCVCVCALQVRVAGAKGNKAQTLYTTDSYVVSLAAR